MCPPLVDWFGDFILNARIMFISLFPTDTQPYIIFVPHPPPPTAPILANIIAVLPLVFILLVVSRPLPSPPHSTHPPPPIF